MKPETASIEVRSLRDALHERDVLAWAAFRQAANAADGRQDADPGLARCAGCGTGWNDETGPLALVDAVVNGKRAVGLLCAACAHGEDVPATLERILRTMLPARSRVVDRRVLRAEQAGHA